jgi:outer membrane protein assembly factor BamB
LSDGGENWKFPTSCSIESKPCVTADTVFVGAWDSYFYAVNRSSGTQRWRYQRNASRYYSPGDSWPVVAPSANRVFVADREYYLNAINITTGASDWTRTGVASQALTPDGSTLLLRNTAGTLEKATFDNGTAWTASCSLDSAPVAPSAAGSHAAVVDQDGLVSVVNVANGAIRYQFQAARGYQLNPVSVDSEGCAYLTTYEGFLLCIASQDPPAKAVADIVVDSRTAGGGQTPNPTYAESGSWMDSTAKSVAVGSAGSGSRFALFSDGTPGTASATPNLAATGSYDVYATWNTSSNARGVTYAVRHRDGITSVVLDQKPAGAAAGTNSHVWNWLGRFSFGAGQNSATGSVTVDETFVTGPFSAYNTGRTYADGFLWVYAGPASNIECWREITGD